MKQRTIQQSHHLTGIGLHSGKPVHLAFHPADIDTGIVFKRSDIADAMPILANYNIVNDTMMSSNLSNEQGQRIGTVEHLMSAIAALGIDNLLIEVSASEIPIMDGSAIAFIEAIQQAGIVEQNAPKKFIKILKPVRVEQDDKFANLSPSEQGFSVTFQIEFSHPAFHQNHDKIVIDFSSHSFIQQVAPARTFGFTKDIEYLQSRNLGLGGSMDNAIVLDEEKVLNPEGLRFDDEFLRHKILDAIGDLYLAGHQILGGFEGYKSGHALNNQLLKQLFSDKSNFEIVTFYDKDKVGIDYF